MKKLFLVAFVAAATFGITTAAHSQSGAAVYKAKCQMCHAADGSGSTPAGKSLKALPFSSPDIIKASDADLIAAITNGKGKMPAYTGKLTDAQIKDQVAYVRTLQK